MMVMSRSLMALGLAILVVSANYYARAKPCNEAIASLMPCLPFVSGTGATPTVPCCLAVKRLNDETTTKEDRKAMCVCLKTAAASFGVKAEKAKQLPDLCGVKVPVPIDPNIDCNTIG